MSDKPKTDMNWPMVAGLLDVILKAAQAGPEFVGLVAQARAELDGEIGKAKDAAAARVKADADAAAKAAADEAERQAKLIEQQTKLTAVDAAPPAVSGPGPMGVVEPKPIDKPLTEPVLDQQHTPADPVYPGPVDIIDPSTTERRV
jgi:hypothetical protein